MYGKGREGGLDGDLAVRLAGLSRAGQRWLRMALLAIEDLETADVAAGGRRPQRRRTDERPVKQRPAANLEDVVKGKSTLDEQLEAYPELSEEMEGLAEVIDMLREAGEARRRTGEQILREEILGRTPEEEDVEEPGAEGEEEEES
jgi:hypothetical protein